MNVFLRLVHLCMGGCRHPHTYRERRTLHGAEVLHFVCEDCGHAVPAIDRTAEEHRHAVAEGAIRPIAVRRHPADVVTIDSGRRRPRTDERRHAS
jgi:hypothetical protein